MNQITVKEDNTRLLTYEKETLQKQLSKCTVAMGTGVYVKTSADLRQSIDSMNKEREEVSGPHVSIVTKVVLGPIFTIGKDQ